MQPDVKPLNIKRRDGVQTDTCWMNEKGYRKSIERGVLWVVHPQTERLLPYGDTASFLSVTDCGDCYEAVVPDSFEVAPSNAISHTVDSVDTGDPNPKKEPVGRPNQKTGTVLSALEAVIRQRRLTLPEGSYTTHLFRSGGEKIRKKTGEEAVELILAADRESIIYEAADLIYHLMVLLESEDISIEAVLAELEKR